MKIKAAVHSFGNIGRHVLDALETAHDFECFGIIRRAESITNAASEFIDLDDLTAKKGKPDVVILCGPSRQIPETAATLLAQGVNTVDSFDIHGDVPNLIKSLDKEAIRTGRAAVSAAGWDPGTDSVLRALFEAMTPIGTTFTNFGRGRSMGHSVAARAIPGVEDATSITIPTGGGRHARLVYVLPREGADREKIKTKLAEDPYFAYDPLDLRFVESAVELDSMADHSHGVRMERTGASGSISNQQLMFDMRINNPALTAQVLVSCARATTRLTPGAYTMIDIPPVALLQGERMNHIARLV